MTTTCPFAGCGVELRRSDVTSHNAASSQTHLDGERAARNADIVSCCAYSADGATVVSGSGDKTLLKLWSVATGACIRTFIGHTDWVLECCFSPADGNTVLSCIHHRLVRLGFADERPLPTSHPPANPTLTPRGQCCSERPKLGYSSGNRFGL